MPANTITSTRRVAAGAVAQHECADRGCLAAMLGLDDATASDAEEFIVEPVSHAAISASGDGSSKLSGTERF